MFYIIADFLHDKILLFNIMINCFMSAILEHLYLTSYIVKDNIYI